MNYQETIQYLYAQLAVFHREGKTAYKANLDNTLALDEYFNHPHRLFKSIHVAGTNGKGSTSHMLAAILQAAGYKTGLYTSPHLLDFRERIKVNGTEIPEQAVVDFVARHRAIIAHLQPSFFELASAMAFDWFAQQGVEVAIIEVGMGGRLDSTNIITPLLSIITNIGLDHTEFLGDSLEKVAVEKAGIIKEGVPVVVGEYDGNTASVFTTKAREQKAAIYFADQCLRVEAATIENGRQLIELRVQGSGLDFSQLDRDRLTVSIDLLGSYQQKNVCTVLTAVAVLLQYGLLAISAEGIFKALPNAALLTGLKGRWQVIGTRPMVVCDTGHNAHGLSYVLQQLQTIAYKRLFIVLGMVNDKDLDAVLPLFPRDAYYFFTQANLPRAMDAIFLASQCRNVGLDGEVVTPVSAALDAARQRADKDDLIFIGGSTFVVAEVL